MDAKGMRDLEDKDLVKHIQSQRKELFGLRFQHATGELENTSGLKNTKREIARALTVARERGIDIDKA
ncbi:50S ribosomal protein L29 [Paraconexibacter sp.]|uniref:50S ribosomal protein L29 n=1 Tax=Paraconexibacter sp. TaxID=2949640 RepID=UPI003564CFD6